MPVISSHFEYNQLVISITERDSVNNAVVMKVQPKISPSFNSEKLESLAIPQKNEKKKMIGIAGMNEILPL